MALFGIITSFFWIQLASSHPDHFDDGQSRVNSADLLYRKGNLPTWYLGKGLGQGDLFTYRICDMVFKMPESPDHCYHISLEFIDVLKGSQGDVWVVQAVIDNQNKKTFAIFQITPSTFDIKTDGTSIPYADSVTRTIFWIGKFANEFNQKPLTVGKSWGMISTHSAPETKLVVRDIEDLDFGKEKFHTFVLGYNLIEQSIININEDFPFPIKAAIYKPITSYQNIPLQFTIELIDYKRSDFVNGLFPQILSNQNESMSGSKDDGLLQEKIVDQNYDKDHIGDNESNMTNSIDDNPNSTGTDYFDPINLEKLFEMFLNEHFDNDTSDEQILNYTVFLDFLNKTDSAVIDGQNLTGS